MALSKGLLLWIAFWITVTAAQRPGGNQEECQGMFYCNIPIAPDRHCISQSWVCDGERDCPDGADEEQNCSPPTCAPGKFACRDGKLCIPDGWVCDGEEDCIDGSDEKNRSICSYGDRGHEETFRCPRNQYQCDGTRLCIKYGQLCDSVGQCPDNSDEGVHCRMHSESCSSSNCSLASSPAHCIPTLEGHVCRCKNSPDSFYFNHTTRQCEDLDECAEDGYCDHLCENTVGSYNCSCMEGYRQSTTNTHHCIAINEPEDQPTFLLVATSHHILLTDVNGTLQVSINESNGRVRAMDFDFDTNTTYYIVEENPMYKAVMYYMQLNKTGAHRQYQMDYDIKAISNIRRDWVSKNWYFTDEDHERIFVCGDDGKTCVTLITTDLKQPKGLAVDPVAGYIFFTTLGDMPKVERASLDGTNRLILLQKKQVVKPQALTLDYVHRHVYIADSYLDRIERINYDGTNRRLIIRRVFIENVHGLSIHENNLYITNQRNKTLSTMDRFDNATKPRRKLMQNLTLPSVVHVVHRQRQPKVTNPPCATLHCEHICVSVRDEARDSPLVGKCLCKAGFKPDTANQSICVPVRLSDDESFLIYSNAKLGQIKGISTDPDKNEEVIAPIEDLQRPVAVDFDFKHDYIYYSDALRHKIGRRKLNDSGSGNSSFISEGVNNCEGIAVDWMSRNIYWTDESHKTINVAKLSNVSMWKRLVTEGLGHPRAIVVDPRNGHGYMYWSDWVQRPSQLSAKISKAAMDGNNVTVLYDKMLQWPNGLTIDYKNERIYWCDAFNDRIESVDLDGNNHWVIMAPATNKQINHPYGLVHRWEGNELWFYWTEFTEGHIMAMKNSTGEISILRNDSVPMFELRYYDKASQLSIGSNPCSNESRCEHLCLMSPQGPRCVCKEGFIYNTETNVCEASQQEQNVTQCNNDDQFLCNNGRCINRKWLCDGDDDCLDGSDESNEHGGICQNRTCPDENLMYLCTNNRCIYKRWMCDGEDDCRNGEDEVRENCSQKACSDNMHRCQQTQRCIPQSWICDHDDDCGDNSDELQCNHTDCQTHQFRCNNYRCISREYVCDGDNDCRDNSDEQGCPECDHQHEHSPSFLCELSGRCIDKIYLCDGDANCATDTISDSSDETNCTEARPPCFEGQFTCGNRLCIHTALKCDGDNDCGDNSDEDNCHVNMTCSAGEYKCPNEPRCIPNRWTCDGENDCSDNSDEFGCDGTTPIECEAPNFLCDNRTKCIESSKLCNDNYECDDGTDEGLLCDVDMCANNDCEYKCNKAPFGFICTCPPGKKLSANNRSCEERHPCEQWSTCSQICEEATDGPAWIQNNAYQCKCYDQFAKDKHDPRMCKYQGTPTLQIIFSNRHEIRRLNVTESSYVSLVSGLRNTIALDFYYNQSSPTGDGSQVFWTDVVDDKIYAGTMIANSVTDIHSIVNIGLATTEGLAVDWIGKHIYWVESNLDQIEVANMNGTQRATLTAGSMTSPRAIVVDPRVGKLFWTDWDPSDPRLEMCSMAGENRRVIFHVNKTTVPGGGWPNGLAADYDKQRIYWIDARSDSIHTINYDGSDHRIILHGHEFLSHPFAISVFGIHVYWTDWRTNSLVQANKFDGSNVTIIQRTITQPFDLHVFNPLRQPPLNESTTNPCNPPGGSRPCDASALCLLTFKPDQVKQPLSYKCKCPHLKRLRPDNRSCELDSSFLLFSKKQEIRGVDLEDATFNVIPALTVPWVYNPLAIDYDLGTKRLYWTDDDKMHGQNGIHTATLNGTDVHTIIDSELSSPKGFAIDWISGNMYFSSLSPEGASISVAKLDGVYRTKLLHNGDKKKSLRLENPSSIAVHPVNGKLYWTDLEDINQKNSSGSIWCSYLDGSNPTQLFESAPASVNGPSSLAIEYTNNQLWWINQKGDSGDYIMYSDLNGGNPRPFKPTQAANFLNKPTPPIALAVKTDKVYMARSEGIAEVHIDNQNIQDAQFRYLRRNTSQVSALKIFIADRIRNGTNKCQFKNGKCSQLCLPTPGSRVCKCTDGYKLNQNGQTCDAFESFLMYSNRTEILGMALDPSDTETKALAPISKITMVTAIDFYAKENFIFWVDGQDRTISRIRRDLTERQMLVKNSIFGVEGLAVDWIAGNLYWTDQVIQTIEVSRLNGSNRYVVVHGSMEKPRSIMVHPVRGKMYWADWSRLHPRIEVANLDGSDRQVLLNSTTSGKEIEHPFGLTIDYEEDEMYWCDQKVNKIHAVDLDTRVVRDVITEKLTDCMGLAVHGDYIYWTDVGSKDGSIMRANKKGKNSGVITMRQDHGKHLRDIKVHHADRQRGTNLCSVDNGGCDELCLFNGTTAVCKCAHGRVVNGTKCADFDSFLAFSKVTGIETIHMFFNNRTGGINNTMNSPTPAIEKSDSMKNVIGLAFDYDRKRYFFSDIQMGNIQTVFFNGSDNRVLVDKVGSAEGLAFDTAYQELYWTSYTDSSISRIRLDKEKAEREKIVQLGDEDHPRAIVIDSCDSRIYWTNWNDRQASIQRSYTNGWNVETLIKDEIRTPNGLTIDHAARKLYWSDARLDKIERCDFDGKNRKIIITNVAQHVFGLSVHGSYLYWTDWILRGVIRANKYTGSDIKWLRKNIARQPMGIIAVAKDTNNCLQNACTNSNGGCNQVCSTNERGEVVCLCFQGHVLDMDNKTCIAPSLRCGDGQFGCRSGGCIDFELSCDGRTHCLDESDEDQNMCKSRVCPAEYFQCHNITRTCIIARKQCDGSFDCEDGSDEKNCQSFCGPDEFRCISDGSCIQNRYKCDYDKDCPDASDEMGCKETTNCSHFALRDGTDINRLVRCNYTTACILDTWVCDGHNDCWDGEDEKCNITHKPPACDDNWFDCGTTNECIPKIWKCDGDKDCSNGLDEKNCPKPKCDDRTHFLCNAVEGVPACFPRTALCDNHNDCVDQFDEKNCSHPVCYDTEFTCKNDQNKCIPKSWVCDGEADCRGGEDEQISAGCEPIPCERHEFQCRNYRCVRHSFYCDGEDDCWDGSDEPPTCEYKHTQCSEDEFRCHNQSECLDRSRLCDGVVDCTNSRDEKDCSEPTHSPICGKDQYECKNSVCIREDQTCDGIDQCGDATDELLCGVNECMLSGRKMCEQVCTNKKIGFTCSCNSGYQLLNDSRSCKDINECDKFPCTHYCINMPGSYRCYCADGYTLEADKRGCKISPDVDLPRPVVLISNRYYIRNISLDGRMENLIVKELTNAVALDFDWQERKIYWSDTTSTQSRIMRMDDNGNRSSWEVLHQTTLRNPDGIAVDWVGRNLYWCDKTTDTIEVSKLDGKYRKVLVKSGLEEPRAIQVHPYKGWLFYTDWGDHAHIGRIGMDGTIPAKRNIVRENLGWPNALTIDYVTEHIIWADARLDYIAFANLDGSNKQIIAENGLAHIFAITVFEDYIYWTDWENSNVERADKYNGTNKRRSIGSTIHRPMDIQVYHPYRQMSFRKDQVNPCENNGGCGEGSLCLIKPGGQQRVCSCPEHFYLSLDKKSCIANCTSSEFLCTNTFKCIPFWWLCDGQDDCGDGSDENGSGHPSGSCPQYHCRQAGLFQCHNATSHQDCISPTQICDGKPQCKDGSDELRCDTHTCLESQFKCTYPPKCIPLSQKCDMKANCNDSSDEKSCTVPRCAENQFKCANKRCIPYVWRCDNDDDCGDNSDEDHLNDCKKSGCKDKYIMCNSTGRCIPESWRCDGDPDCGVNDDSDEPQECEEQSCEPTYFKCNNNRCIPGRWRCDYDDDCRDGSDEEGCTLRNCTAAERRCESDGRCIAAKFWCDGQKHCHDGSDEENCGENHCDDDESQWKCASGRFCIDESWRCDGEMDCVDASDEKNCNRTCSWQEFKCNNSMCIPKTWQCDGHEDCLDGSDEVDAMCETHRCMFGQFRCTKNNRCVPREKMCNGVEDCPDGTDEEGEMCNALKPSCDLNEFKCAKFYQCIKLEYVCDGHKDCLDGSDEPEESCNWHGVCSSDRDCTVRHAFCNNTDGDPATTGLCQCRSGRQYLSRMCLDINECYEHARCSQGCVNTWGKYHCTCHDNYYRGYDQNRQSICVARGTNPYILIAAENEIHKCDVTIGGEYKRHYPEEQTVDKGMLKIGSMDILWDKKLVFVSSYSDTDGATGIYSYPIPDKLSEFQSERLPRRKRETDPSQRTKGTSMRKLDIEGLKQPMGLTVDWVNDKLYWTDAKTDKIEMSNLDGTMRKTIVENDMDVPHAIAVDPISKQLFWTDWGLTPKIERSDLDGDNRTTLVSTDIAWPTGLTIDYPGRWLYWSDAKLGKIEAIHIDDWKAKNRRVVWDFNSFPGKHDFPYSIDVYDNLFYVTTYRNHSLLTLSKLGPSDFSNATNEPVYLASQLKRVGDLVIVQQYKQSLPGLNESEVNRCRPSSCDPSAICINVALGIQCICPNDHNLVRADKNVVKCIPQPAPIDPCSGYCKNGGICRLTEKGNPKCKCGSKYIGGRCQYDVCKDYCQNNGKCDATGGNLTCDCPKEFGGHRCELYKCANLCENGGRCYMNLTKDPVCVCPVGYAGDVCEIKVTNPCAYITCYNGGRCQQLAEDKVKCECHSQYSGERCERCAYVNGKEHICNVDIYGASCFFDGKTNAMCKCPSGYTNEYRDTCDPYGKHCKGYCVDTCDDYCQNGGTCQHERNDTKTCTCRPGFSGNTCEIDLCKDKCVERQGECVADGRGVRCECTSGFVGDRCESIAKACLHEPCQNNATCIPHNNEEHTCECALGFEGPLCQYQKGCRIVHCGINGKCLKINNAYQCRCDRGYDGVLCEEELPTECVTVCKNNGRCTRGSCNRDGDTPYCEKCTCYGDWGGDRCERKLATSTSSTSAIVIVIPILICLLALFIILAIIIYRKRSNNQFKHKRMNEPPGNLEITNPIYTGYDDDEGGPDFGEDFDSDKPTNFSNPIYDQFYAEDNTSDVLSPESSSEKKELLHGKKERNKIYLGDEERQPLGGHSSTDA